MQRKLRGSTPLPKGKLYNLPLIRLEKFQRSVKGCGGGQNAGRLNNDVADRGGSTEEEQELHSMGTIDPDDLRGYSLHDAKHKFCVDEGFQDLIDGTRRVGRVPRM